MADWFLVPCLSVMRAEWNAISPSRDRGADGTIGDQAHASRTSDHNPDSKGRVLALDIDSSGPWPGGFDHYVQRVVARQRAGTDSRLEYVIWNRKIASRNSHWAWETYTGSADPHTGHAHFSARHDHTGQDDVRPWHIADQEDDMDWNDTFNSPSWKARAGTNKPTYGNAVVLSAIWSKDAITATTNALSKLLDAYSSLDQVDEQALGESIAAALAPQILAELPEGTLTSADVEAAVRNVLRTGTGA